MPARRTYLLAMLASSLALAGCAGSSPRFTSADNTVPITRDISVHQMRGIASYYAEEFHGRNTASGEPYNMNAMTAAHRTLPFNTRVRVTNLENQKSVVVTINDRGPYKDDRVIDLSFAAGKAIGLIANGTAPVQLDIVQRGNP